ncbi:MAG: phospholipid-binding lipoprotein MlaA [Verrucomicrobia bacterium]|nr:MAG: phospholipid-binding lipoprotein MlaA [Verrucomicrobiota bacterium]
MRSHLKIRTALLLAASTILLVDGSPVQAGTTSKEVKTPRSSHHKYGKPDKHGKHRKPTKRIHSKFNPVSTFDDPYGDEQVRPMNDSFEPFNRAIFALNHQFYRFVAKPLAKATVFLIPKPVLNAAGRVIDNVESPVRIGSSLLQGKFKRAGQETGKLLVNSTLGVAGIWKPSDKIGALKRVPAEDVGQAFGNWGIPAGPYLVLPVLGPSSVRDLVGKVGDSCLNPESWLGTEEFKRLIKSCQAVVENPDRMETYNNATADAVDPYVSMRESFVSYRRNAVEK